MTDLVLVESLPDLAQRPFMPEPDILSDGEYRLNCCGAAAAMRSSEARCTACFDLYAAKTSYESYAWHRDGDATRFWAPGVGLPTGQYVRWEIAGRFERGAWSAGYLVCGPEADAAVAAGATKHPRQGARWSLADKLANVQAVNRLASSGTSLGDLPLLTPEMLAEVDTAGRRAEFDRLLAYLMVQRQAALGRATAEILRRMSAAGQALYMGGF